MKLFAVLAASAAADSQWKAQCTSDADGNWGVVAGSMCGQQFKDFQPVNNTCTFAGGADAAVHKFLGGGAFIESDNTFFGVDGLTSSSGDLVVFGNHAAGLCNEQWHNASDAGFLENCDFGPEPACTPTVGSHSGFYFMETVNDHRQNKDASYNFQFWGENAAVEHLIYDYINETAGKVPTDSEPLSYTLDHQQYNNKVFTASFKNHLGGALDIVNCSCGSPDCSISVAANVVTMQTAQVNSQLCGFSCFVSGDEVPDLWSSSIVGA